MSSRRKVVPRDTVIEKLKKAIAELEKRVPVDCVYLYGSYAKGEPHRYSDIDVAVVSPVFGANIVKDTVFLMEIFESAGLMVEPRAYSRAEYQEAKPGTFLYDEVIMKGLRLV